MSNFLEQLIAGAAEKLGSNKSYVQSEAHNIPNNSAIFNSNQSLNRAIDLLVAEIRAMRNAETEFFRSHPELNP